MFLKVSAIHKVVRFGQKGKLSKIYVWSFEAHSWSGDVAYSLTLLLELSSVHKIFHMSMMHLRFQTPPMCYHTSHFRFSPMHLMLSFLTDYRYQRNGFVNEDDSVGQSSVEALLSGGG